MSVPRSAKEETSTDNINQKESSSDKQQRLNFMRTPKLQGKLDLTQKRRNGKINTDSLSYSRKSSLEVTPPARLSLCHRPAKSAGRSPY